jgi:hypothetical protein
MPTLVTIPTAVAAAVPAAIQAAAAAVADAEVAFELAATEHGSAASETAKLRDRLADLEARRAEIVSRRQVGDCRADDGADLALIAADGEGLAALLAEAQAAETPLRQKADAATTALANARMLLQRAEDEAAEAQLIAHARRLDGLLLETISQLAEVGQRLGRPVPPWGASPELREKLRRIGLLRREA